MLSDAEKRFLLRVARHSVEAAVNDSALEEFTSEFSPALCSACGAFVTLRNGTDLRGCIGYVDPVRSLVETVREVSAKAATDDIRFHPLSPDELRDIWIEISVLSPLTPLADIGEIDIGNHGLVVQSGRRRGLLLPQVAVEYGWDRETFISQTARKAGLSGDGWMNPSVTVFTFTAEVFSERSIPAAASPSAASH